jgi:hypothetical protein
MLMLVRSGLKFNTAEKDSSKWHFLGENNRSNEFLSVIQSSSIRYTSRRERIADLDRLNLGLHNKQAFISLCGGLYNSPILYHKI